MTPVWLVRHGASTAPAGVAIGVTDPPLSEAGRAQALDAAAALAGRSLARVLASDLRRARETAEAVAAPHGLAVETSPALREIDFGAWEGRSLRDLWTSEPEAARAWERDLRATPPSFGERLGEVERRVGELWASLGPPAPGGELAVVAHRGPLAVLYALIARVPLEAAFAVPFGPGSATQVEAAWP
jgi:probable phosphoglycerate mutase